MTPVMYIGFSDERILTSSDLTNLGVEEESDLVFRRGERVEVSEELADILLGSNTILSREFRPWDDEVTLDNGPRVEADDESRELQRQVLAAEEAKRVASESSTGDSAESEVPAKTSKSKAGKSG